MQRFIVGADIDMVGVAQMDPAWVYEAQQVTQSRMVMLVVAHDHAQLAVTPPRAFGVDDFCSRCRVCENACPPEAIAPDKQLVRGVEKWYLNFDRCLPFFNQHHGCAICIAICPWSRPGAGLNLADKMARRRARPASAD